MPGIHEAFYPYLLKVLRSFQNPQILEIGAGHGALTQKLWNDGFQVVPSDLFPENFYFEELTCLKLDITDKMPFENQSFDMVIAVEVMEHIHDHEVFFRECNRILKKGGKLVFSTPNILSLKSRMRFLFSGFFYAFNPLEHERNDGLQHISSLTVDQYKNLGKRNNLELTDISIDKKQNTSRIFLAPFYPFLLLYCWIKRIDFSIHNQYLYLVGRIFFITFTRS